MSTPDLDLIARLAALVAKPGAPALYLNEDNVAGGWDSSIERAARSGRTFAVEVQDTIFAVDCDVPAFVPELDSIEQRLIAENIEPVRLRSGGEGREHLFARITDPRRMAFWTAHATALGHGTQLEVRRVIRPPLSPHRLGHDVGLLRPDNAAEVLAALTPQRPRDLSPEQMAFLKDGAPKKKRSGKIVGFCLAAVNAAWTFGDVYWAMMDPANLGGEKVREKRDPLDYLDRWCWQRAVEQAERSPAVLDRAGALAEAARISARASSWLWDRRTGETDRRVFLVHLDIALRTGKLVHSASVRFVADKTGFSYGAVREARKRLAAAGWLRLDRPAARWTAEASVWRISMPWAALRTAESFLFQSLSRRRRPSVAVPYPEHPVPGEHQLLATVQAAMLPAPAATAPGPLMHYQGVSESMGAPGAKADIEHSRGRRAASDDIEHSWVHDAWCRGGLGSRARSVYEALDETAFRSPDDLDLAIGVNRKTLMKWLTRLRRLGLAMLTDRGWVRGCASLDMLAIEHDVLGNGAKRRKEHEVQRTKNREELARWLAAERRQP